MQRNRDLNRDGKIDDDEVRWYLPAVNQYGTGWIGEDGMVTSSRFFQESVTDAAANGSDYNKLSHFYTSGNDSERIYWAIEGGSYGRFDNSYMAAKHHVRCARNLQSETGVPAKPTVPDAENRTFDLGALNEKGLRTTVMRGEYGAHSERMVQNHAPRKFRVAKSDLQVAGTSAITFEQLEAATNLCAANYSEESDGSDLGLWRVPNQRELMIMSRNTGVGVWTPTSGVSYMCKTTFSNTNVNRDYFLFEVNAGIIRLRTNKGDKSGYIRCVRDVD